MKNIIILLIFLSTNLLEVAFAKPFFHHFLFLNIVVLVIFATNSKFYTQSLVLGLVYGVIVSILFSSSLFLLPAVFVLAVFVLNKLGLWFGQKLIQKLVYIVVSITLLRLFTGNGSITQVFGSEMIFIVIYALFINFLSNKLKQYVDY